MALEYKQIKKIPIKWTRLYKYFSDRDNPYKYICDLEKG